MRGKTLRYVSRGGLKLEKAMQCFPLTLQDAVAMDCGASTGGVTDCMLPNGAKKGYAGGVGYGQLGWEMRQDERGGGHCLLFTFPSPRERPTSRMPLSA